MNLLKLPSLPTYLKFHHHYRGNVAFNHTLGMYFLGIMIQLLQSHYHSMSIHRTQLCYFLILIGKRDFKIYIYHCLYPSWKKFVLSQILHAIVQLWVRKCSILESGRWSFSIGGIFKIDFQLQVKHISLKAVSTFCQTFSANYRKQESKRDDTQ